MTRRRLGSRKLLVLALGCVLLIPAGVAAPASAKRCGTMVRANGNIMYSDIRAKGVSCRKARKLLPGAAERLRTKRGLEVSVRYAGWRWTMVRKGPRAADGVIRGCRGDARIRWRHIED
jgi:hypothetical protein